MTAQTKLIEYAKKLLNQSNTGLDKMTPEEIMGQAFVKGICYLRQSDTRFSCKITRQGKTITVYDVESGTKIDGRGISEKYEISTIVEVIEL